jgi:NAD(P)-dependent dehydrogenase (short-subunit alcohol dehydrogenase family)
MSVLDQFRLDGKRALVTGGSKGLGLEMARALADAGAEVVLVGRNADALASAAADLGRTVSPLGTIAADIGTPDGAEQMCRQALERYERFDILISNVGGRRISLATEQMSLSDWQRIVDLNLTSTFVCCKQIGAAMVARRRGVIITVASIAAIAVTRGVLGRAYEAAKGAVISFTKSLAADWAPFGVRVNSIAPGCFLTEPNRRRFVENPDLRGAFEDMIPMGRLGDPREVGPLALYLASDASSYVTGETVVIDGGYTVW